MTMLAFGGGGENRPKFKNTEGVDFSAEFNALMIEFA